MSNTETFSYALNKIKAQLHRQFKSSIRTIETDYNACELSMILSGGGYYIHLSDGGFGAEAPLMSYYVVPLVGDDLAHSSTAERTQEIESLCESIVRKVNKTHKALKDV